MKARYESWVEGLNGDWLVSRQRFFGVPFPVWYPLDARRRARLRPAARARRGRPPGRPAERRARRATPRTSGACPAASSATPTSWTRGPRRRSPRRSPASGATTPTCSPATYPMDLRPQAHEIIRTWLFSTVVRAHSEFGALPVDRRRDQRLGPRPRPQEDVEVEGQRRHADRPARAVRLRRGALLGGERPARHRHRVRRGPDEDRPSARDQDPQRVEVRARRDRRRTRCRRPASPRSTEPLDRVDARRARRPRRRRHRRRSSSTTTRARSSAPSGSSGASATTTSSS